MKVITIIGASATGKSFLSQAYHQKYSSIPFYQFDTIGDDSDENIAKLCSTINKIMIGNPKCTKL